MAAARQVRRLVPLDSTMGRYLLHGDTLVDLPRDIADDILPRLCVWIGLSQPIYNYELGGNISQLEEVVFNGFTDPRMTNIDVLGAAMIFGVDSKCKSSLIVAVKAIGVFSQR